MSRAVMTLALGLFMATVAFPAPAQVCRELSEIESGLARQEWALKVTSYEGRDALALIKAYNAEPPPTDIDADLVLVVAPKMPGFERIFLFKAKCLIEWTDLARGWADRVLGGGSR